MLALLVITCAKEEDPIVTPPAVVIPPPSFVIPPVTSPETSTPPSYDGGDISISSREDLDYYREINVQNITGNFELNLDWTYVDNSTSDPSVFTKNIQTVTGDVSINVSTNEEVSLENLLKVGGNYSVTGADVIDDNLLYAKSISLDYEDNYEIKTVYTDEIKLNVGKWKIKKNKSFSTSKNFLGNISMTAYHTDLFNLNLEDVITGDVSGTTYIDSLRETLPVMPDDNPVYTEFRQISDEPSTSGSIISDNISSITIGGHINVNKITSESCTEIKINNTELPSIEVVSTSVVTFEMPNLIELVSIILNLPKVDKLEFPLLVSITNISVTGVNEFSSPLLETIKGNFTLSGVSTAGLPKLETLGGTSSLPSNVNLTTGSGAPTLDRTGTAVPTGGASTGSGTSSSVGLGNTGDSSTGDGDDTEHNSGGSGDTPHNSGGSGDTPHNSGGSGDTAHDSGGSSGQESTSNSVYFPQSTEDGVKNILNFSDGYSLEIDLDENEFYDVAINANLTNEDDKLIVKIYSTGEQYNNQNGISGWWFFGFFSGEGWIWEDLTASENNFQVFSTNQKTNIKKISFYQGNYSIEVFENDNSTPLKTIYLEVSEVNKDLTRFNEFIISNKSNNNNATYRIEYSKIYDFLLEEINEISEKVASNEISVLEGIELNYEIQGKNSNLDIFLSNAENGNWYKWGNHYLVLDSFDNDIKVSGIIGSQNPPEPEPPYYFLELRPVAYANRSTCFDDQFEINLTQNGLSLCSKASIMSGDRDSCSIEDTCVSGISDYVNYQIDNNLREIINNAVVKFNDLYR